MPAKMSKIVKSSAVYLFRVCLLSPLVPRSVYTYCTCRLLLAALYSTLRFIAVTARVWLPLMQQKSEKALPR